MQHIQTFTEWAANSVKLLAIGILAFWHGAWWHKLISIIVLAIVSMLLIGYGVAVWYRASTADQPMKYGVTFVADYARALGVDPEDTMDALIEDVGARRFRLVSYWNKIEKKQGTYDFSELDWQFKKAEASNSEVSLSIGLRQPRWPECHMPDWAKDTPVEEWSPQLNEYITAVVNRYKNSPSLDSYQLENEYNLEAFGRCPDHSQDRLQSEFDLVKKLDPDHPVILSRSSNQPAIITSSPVPDIVGMSVYRKVWDGNVTKRYFTYPLPAWYYGSLAGFQKIVTDRDSMLHEMQMEPWPPRGQFVADVSLEEQNKSFSSDDFQNRVDFANRTGMRTVDFWGAEWWYWRKEVKNDPSFWNEAKATFK